MKALDLLRHFPVAWKMVRRYRAPSGTLGEPFYIVFEPGGGIFGEQWNEFDENGILCKGYNPVSIAQYGLHCHALFCEGDESARDPFLRHARYLRDRQDPGGLYRYSFAHAAYGLKPGWISSLAQAEAASLLFRAYACTQDGSFLESALSALAPFTRDIEDGGVSFLRGNDVFFEECPGCPTHIFPGHLVSAFALWEATRYGFASRELRDLHEHSVETLLRWLPMYDADGWSYYQLAVRNGRRYYAAITYHQMNINLLRIYAAMTQRAEFERMAASWREGLDRWDVRLRVWCDSAAWVLERATEKLNHTSAQAWQPMTVPLTEC